MKLVVVHDFDGDMILGDACDIQRIYRTMCKHWCTFSHCDRARFTMGKVYGLSHDAIEDVWYVVTADTALAVLSDTCRFVPTMAR